MDSPALEDVANTPNALPIYLPRDEPSARTAYFRDGTRAAFFQYLERARLGSASAQATVALFYLLRRISNCDFMRNAEIWSRKSAAQKDTYGQWVLGWVQLENRDILSGIQSLLESARQGFSPAIYHLGLLAIDGVGLQRNLDLGLSLVRKSARSGHFVSKVYLLGFYNLSNAALDLRLLEVIALRLQVILDPIIRLLPKNLFGSSRLVYYRQIEVQNNLKGIILGGEVKRDFENMLKQLVRT